MKRLIVILILCVGPCFAWDVIPLDLPANAPEAAWRDALAKLWNGKTEVVIPYGRIDVATPDYVVELDFLHKWAEGCGQALFYAESTGKQGVVALIVECPAVAEQIAKAYLAQVVKKLKAIEDLLNKHDLHLVVLVRKSR